MNAIVKSENGNGAKKLSIIASVASRYGMEPGAFEKTLRATVVPDKCSPEQFAAFLLVANEYSLNPLTKEIFCLPKQGGGIIPVVSVDGWVNLIQSNKQMDGMEFEDALDADGNLVSVTCKIYRKDRSRPVTVTEYMVECKKNNDTWRTWPRRMLRHKAMIQGARYAFGFAGIYDQDEAERIASSEPEKVVNVKRPPPPDDAPTEPAEKIKAPPPPTELEVEIIDPEAVLRAVDNALAEGMDLGGVDAIWETEGLELTSKLTFPSDQNSAAEIYQKHRNRVAKK